MKLQQLRFLIEVVDSDLNVTIAAKRLFTSQPGVSKQVRLLESELGIVIFERAGKRLTGLTSAGQAIIRSARRVLLEADNFKRVGEEFRDDTSGTLTVATTHTQARYVLPPIVAEFVHRFPQVRLSIREASPGQVAEAVQRGEAEIGIATESLAMGSGLVTLPAYSWVHLVIAPEGHALVASRNLTLRGLARHPIITYDPAFSGRSRLDEAFYRAGVEPNFVLTAIDSDVIKTYVSLGLGVGIIAERAFDPKRDTGLQAIPAGHLFGTNVTRVALRQGIRPRNFVTAFLNLLSPQLTEGAITAASNSSAETYDI